MSKVPADEQSTKSLVREALSGLHNRTDYQPTPCGRPECIFEQQKETWLDSRFLKTAGVIVATLSPLFVWIVLEIFSLKGEVGVMKEKQNAIIEMQQDIKQMSKDLSQIQIDIATLKATRNNP